MKMDRDRKSHQVKSRKTDANSGPRAGHIDLGAAASPGRVGFGDVVLDLAGALVVVLDREGRIVHFNGACQRTTGYSFQRVRGRRIWDFLALPEERAAAQAVFEQLRMGLYPNSFEYYWVTKNGDRRYIAWVNTVILDENQDVQYIVGSGVDITERKQAEDREREYAGYLAILSESVIGFVREANRDNIYRMLVEGLRQLVPQAIYISVSQYHPLEKTIVIKEVAVEPALQEAFEKTFQRQLKGLELAIEDPRVFMELVSGRFHRISGGLYELTFGQLRKKDCQKLEKAAAAGPCYGIGLSSGNRVFGTAAIFMPRGQEIASPLHIETLVNQAAVALMRIEAEAELASRERRFRALIENTGDIITILDDKGLISYKSPAVKSELGYLPEELIGEDIFDYIHPQDRPAAQEAFRQVLENPGRLLRANLRFRHRDGTWRILDVSGINLLADPAIQGVVINSRDVTERVRDQELLRESEDRYRSLVELSPDGCAIHQEGRIVFINRAGAKMLGAEVPDQILGRDIMDLAHPDGRALIQSRAREVKEGELLMTLVAEKFVRLDGTAFDVEVMAGPITYQGRPAVHVMFRDITQKKKVEDAIRESEQRYRTTLEALGDLIHLIDRQYRILYVNPAFKAFLASLGYNQELVGLTYQEAFPFLPPKVKEEYDLVFSTGQPLVTEEVSFINGREIFTETRKIPVRLEGQVARIVTVIRDVTEKKRAEVDIRESKERFQHLADRITEGILIYEDGRLVYVNERALEILGLSKESLVSFDLLSLAAPEEKGRLAQITEHAPAPGLPPEQAAGWILRPDGSRRYIHLRTYYTRKGRESSGYFLVISDITEKRLNELALLESERQYRELFEGNPLPMWIYDPQSLAFIAVNEAAVKLYGYSQEEFAAMTIKDIRPIEDLPLLMEALARASGQSFHRVAKVRHRTKDGHLLLVEVTGHPVKFAGRDARLVMINDITERQRIEEAVRESEEKFRALAEQSPNMIFINQGGRIIYANPRCQEVMGYALEELYAPDFDFLRLISPEDRDMIEESYRRHLAGQELEAYDCRLLTKSGDRLEVVINTKLMDLKSGPAIMGLVTDVTRMREAERQINETRERLAHLVENLNEVVYSCDEKGVLTYVSPAVQRVLGYRPEEMVGKHFSQFIHPDDLPGVTAELSATLEGRLSPYEYRLITRDGSWRYVRSSSRPYHREGRPAGLNGVVADITDRHLAEESLRQSQQRYRSLVESINEGLVQVDSDQVIQFVNHSFCRIVGYAADDLIGTVRLEQLILPEDRERLAGMSAAVAGDHKQRQQVRLKRQDGEVIWADIDCSQVAGEDRAGTVYIVSDITESKLAADRIQESEERYRLLAEKMPDAVFIYDGEKFVYANPAGLRLLGVSSFQEIQGRSRYDFVHPDYREFVKQRSTLVSQMGGEALPMEQKVLRADGSQVDVNVKSIQFPLGGRNLILSIVRDITELKRAEQVLRESEEKYRQIFEGISEGIYRSTPDGRPLMANPALVRMLGYDSLEGVLARNIEEQGYFDPSVRQQFKKMMEEKGEVKDFVNTWRRADGTELVVRENAHAVRDEQGRILYYEGTVEDITEQHRIQSALDENQRRLSTLMANLPGLAYRCRNDERWTMELVSQGCQELTEYQPEELVGNQAVSYADLILPEDREMVWNEVQQAVANQRPFQILYRIRTKGGQLKWVWEQGTAVFDSQGRVEALEGFITDISPRMLAEEALFNSEHQYRTTIDAMGDPIYVVDGELRIMLVNEAFKRNNRLLGFEPEAVGRQVFEVYPHLEGQRLQDEYRRVFQTGSMLVSEETFLVNGKEYVIECRKIPVFEAGKVVRVVTIDRDITEKRRAEKALRESEEKYRQMFEGIAEGIYRSTPEGRVELANPALLRILGYQSLEEIRNLDLNRSGYLHPEDRKRFMEIMEAQGEVRDFEAQWLRRDGRVVILNENAKAVRDARGQILYYEGTVEDITQRKLAEQALIDEKNKLADLFKVSLTVAGERSIPQKIDLTMEGIRDIGLFKRAALVIRHSDGSIKYFAQFGLSPEEEAKAKSSVVPPEKGWEVLLREGRRLSNSYLLRLSEMGSKVDEGIVILPGTQLPGSEWRDDDSLIVPLRIGGKKAGYITLDEPKSGTIPTLEEIHLLELFANQLAVSIENMMLYDDLKRSYYSTLKAFVAAMEAKDPYTKGHSENVRHYALRIAKSMDLPQDRITLIDYSALLHDIGKLGVREEILSKPDVLSREEYQEVKLHPEIGSRMVSDIEMLQPTAQIIHSHHEYYDGQGYPRGLKGEEIPLESRIISVADAYEAMTSDRPYRRAFDKNVAIERLRESAGKQFDAQIVELFAGIMMEEER